jgi:predicted nucleic acid-binding protein
MVFVDTSAVLALLDSDDRYHSRADRAWAEMLLRHRALITTNYIVLETCALLQRRFGMDALKTFCNDILPVLAIEWVTPRQHEIGLAMLIAANRRKLSLVDCVSFTVMRERRAHEAFAFDAHFREEGFDCNPNSGDGP